jgi:hypothetical protein
MSFSPIDRFFFFWFRIRAKPDYQHINMGCAASTPTAGATRVDGESLVKPVQPTVHHSPRPDGLHQAVDHAVGMQNDLPSSASGSNGRPAGKLFLLALPPLPTPLTPQPSGICPDSPAESAPRPDSSNAPLPMSFCLPLQDNDATPTMPMVDPTGLFDLGSQLSIPFDRASTTTTTTTIATSSTRAYKGMFNPMSRFFIQAACISTTTTVGLDSTSSETSL